MDMELENKNSIPNTENSGKDVLISVNNLTTQYVTREIGVCHRQ